MRLPIPIFTEKIEKKIINMIRDDLILRKYRRAFRNVFYSKDEM